MRLTAPDRAEDRPPTYGCREYEVTSSLSLQRHQTGLHRPGLGHSTTCHFPPPLSVYNAVSTLPSFRTDMSSTSLGALEKL